MLLSLLILSVSFSLPSVGAETLRIGLKKECYQNESSLCLLEAQDLRFQFRIATSKLKTVESHLRKGELPLLE
jgi:hypothetical protein